MGRVWFRWGLSVLVLSLSFALMGCGPQAESNPPTAKALSGSIDPLFGVEKFAGQTQLQTMYRLAILNTGAQITQTRDGTAYVKTGDIPAEWLRDSSAQVRPYLFLVRSSPTMAALVRAVIQRQVKCLAVDPYANAFKEDYSIWERKFELDSLAYPILLAWTYWKLTDDRTIFTAELKRGFAAALDTMELEQDHEGHHSSYDHPTLSRHKVGHTGMIWSGFRPSDDRSYYI